MTKGNCCTKLYTFRNPEFHPKIVLKFSHTAPFAVSYLAILQICGVKQEKKIREPPEFSRSF